MEFHNRKREDMKRLKKCTLPKNHRDYYYIMVDTDKRTGKRENDRFIQTFSSTLFQSQ